MAFQSLSLIDPELRQMAEMVGSNALTDEGINGAREGIAQLFQMLGNALAPDAPTARKYEIGVAGVSLRIQVPRGPSRIRPAIIHFHAGGFVSGSASMCDALNWKRAEENDAIVVSIDYRLAPETCFPGPLDDCMAALKWVVEHAHDLGIDTQKIILLGESAGGGLAASLALMARDSGGPSIAAQILIYPMLDYLTGSLEDPREHGHGGEYFWTATSNQFAWNAFQGEQAVRDDQLGYYSPIHAKTFEKLPATFIAVGSLDVLMEESLDFAKYLTHSGVPTECHIYPGAFHSFDAVSSAAVTGRLLSDVNYAIQCAIQKTSSIA